MSCCCHLLSLPEGTDGSGADGLVLEMLRCLWHVQERWTVGGAVVIGSKVSEKELKMPIYLKLLSVAIFKMDYMKTILRYKIRSVT